MNAEQLMWKNWQIASKLIAGLSLAVSFAMGNLDWLAVLPVAIGFQLYAAFNEGRVTPK